jgi:hypothetical protein
LSLKWDEPLFIFGLNLNFRHYTEGAFARLSSELFALQERLDPALLVEAVNHDVYEWDIKFCGGFPAGSDIASDLELLEAGELLRISTRPTITSLLLLLLFLLLRGGY